MRGALFFPCLVAIACNASAPPPDVPIVVAVGDAGYVAPLPVASEPVPPAAPETVDEPGTAPFDRGVAATALSSVNVQPCAQPGGPVGAGRVRITFAPSGAVSTAIVDTSPYAGTPVAGCIASLFRRVRIKPFAGAPVTVGKSFTLN